ncbi:MED25 [Mytilus coruscus]|uniref:Mediator of RNA polymerase II transcription subunit 25 n=1 Tax=Mytilus coruscus TaxID=42192 RepID=A0A6J8A6I1_MYTCO|nr:MED25 [Mytilus coruscus]
MVISDSFKNPSDVVFVVEGTANLGGYIDVLKENYIIPTLEVFNGGPADPTDYGRDYSCTLYNMVTFYSADIMPDPAARCSDVTTNIHEFLTWLDNTPFIGGGGGETCSHIAEGLSTALHVFDDLAKLRKQSVGNQVSKHCILVCNSPPYQMPSQESPRYLGFTCDQLAGMMAQRRINLSIISPRKIAALQKMYEESSNQEMPMMSSNNFTVDPRHHILLHGYQLEERSLSPSVDSTKDIKLDQRSEVCQSPPFSIPNAPLSRAYSPSSTVVFSPADGNQSQPQDQNLFKVPSTAPSSNPNMQSNLQSMQSLPYSANSPINQPPTSQFQQQQQQISNFGQQPNQTTQLTIQGQQIGQHPSQQQQQSQQSQQAQQPQMYGQGQNQQQQQQQQFPNQFGGLDNMGQQNQFHSMSASVTMPTSMHVSHPGMAQRSQPGVGDIPFGFTQNKMNMGQPTSTVGFGSPTMADIMTTPSSNMAGNNLVSGDFNRVNQAVRMPAINPAITMQQNIGSSQGIMSTSIQSPQQGNQQSGSQQPIQPGIDPGNLPIIPNPPIQGQNKDRKIIWSGMLEYQEKIKSNGPTQPKMARQLQCQLSIGSADPEIITTNWPKELIMQLIPQSLLSSPQLQPLFKSSRQVAFHFGNHNVDSLRNLHRTMGSGFAGCVHFPPGTQCDVRVLLLLFSNKRKAFIGLIPNDQKAFVDGIRNVIFTHKLKQAQAQQQAGGSPQQFVQPQGGLQMGQGMANSPQMQQPGATNTMASTGMVTQTSNMIPQAGNMQQIQQQQAMQQKLQQAKLQEQQKQQQLLAQQRLHQQRLQLQQQQQQQQANQQQVSNHQLQQLLLSQQQQGQQIRQPQMMMQQQLRGPNPQGQQNVMGGGQQMMPNTMQMSQQGQVMGQGQSNLLDDFNFSDLI